MIRTAVLVLVLVAATARPGLAAQDPPAPPVAEVASEAASSVPGREQAQARLAELEGGSGDEAVREALSERYRQLVQFLDAEKANLERAESFKRAVEAVPDELARVRAELAQIEAEGVRPPAPDATVDGLQVRLTQLQAELVAAKAQQAELEKRLADEEARPGRIPAQMTEARGFLDKVQAELDALGPEPTPDAAEGARAERWVLAVRRRARTAEIAMLEQEALSNALRVELLQARVELLRERVARGESEVTALETRLSDLRKAEAQRARQEAERLRAEAIGKHPLIQALAAEIGDLTRDTQQKVQRIDGLRAKRKEAEARLAQLGTDYDQIQRSLELGITRSLGTVLLEQRRGLPDARTLRRGANERAAEATDARVRLFEIERSEVGLADVEARAAELVRGQEPDGLTPEELADLRAEVAELLATKRDNLRLLAKALGDYLSAVRDLEARERELLDISQRLAAILDQRLLWIPNAPPVSLVTLQRTANDVLWLVSPGPWMEVWAALTADMHRRTAAWGGVALVLAGLLAAGPRLSTRLSEIADKVNRKREDRLSLTLRALLCQVLQVVPVPGAVALVGWRLSSANDGTDASKAIGAGLTAAAGASFFVLLVRALWRRDGVASVHFHWSRESGRLMRRHLLWFLAVLVPTAFAIGLTEEHPDTLRRYGLGRMAFIVLTLGAGVLAAFLLRQGKGVFSGAAVREASLWLRRSRGAWLPVGVLLAVALAVMAAAGYHYAALQLEYRLNQTLLLILLALCVQAYCLRWIRLSRRKLAVKVAMEKRAALAKSRQGGEEAAAEGVIEAIEEIDVAEIEDQTQDLLRISVGLGLALGLWVVWVGVMPALRVLDEITLWSHTVVVDGQPVQNPITLANLGLALLLVAVTVTAARNMPGFLEIAVLQRLPLDHGARYATRTLTLYAIVGTGVILAFNSLGVDWSSIQWLVAALTVGLGFGLQEIFANFVSGLIILLERPIRVGDTVTVGSVSGVVTRIRMRATTITDWSRRELVVPNKSFITGELINWSLSDPILRLEFPVGIAYGSDTTLAHQTMLEVCRKHPMVLDQPEPNVFFLGFGDNSLNFDVRVFVNETTNTGRSRILHELHMAIDAACRERKITIAFPQRDLHLKTAEAVLRVAVEPKPAGG